MSSSRRTLVTPPAAPVPPVSPQQLLGAEEEPVLQHPVAKAAIRPVGQQTLTTMTPETEQQLRSLGLDPRKPIPGNIADIVQGLRTEIERERRETKIENTDLAKLFRAASTTTVDISQLSPERQAEVQQVLRDYQKHAAIPPVAPPLPPMPPPPQSTSYTSAIVDDRAGSPPLPKTPVLSQQMPQAAPTPAAPPDNTDTGATPPVTVCPCCNWDITKPFTVEATQDDRYNFLISLLGTKRFSKTMHQAGGKVSITFRSLTMAEIRLLGEHMTAKMRSGEIAGDAAYLQANIEYRTAMSLEKIEIGGLAHYHCPPVLEWAAARPRDNTPLPPTPLDDLIKHVYDNGLQSEPLARLAGAAYRMFMQLLAVLEATVDSDFYQGIDLQR